MMSYTGIIENSDINLHNLHTQTHPHIYVYIVLQVSINLSQDM